MCCEWNACACVALDESNSFPESDVVSPTDEMFGHPPATLAVANEHLDAIGETPLTCSGKSCGANSTKGKSPIITAMI